jgi:hypothetical protein
MSDGFARNLHLLWRSESIVADIKLRQLLVRVGFAAAAALVAVLGLAMLNLGGWLSLQGPLGSAAAATILGLIDFGIAVILLLLSMRLRPSRELELASEMRKRALDTFETDVQSMQTELSAVREQLQQVSNGLAAIAKHPLDAALTALVVPAASVLLKSLKKSEPSP